MRILFEIVDLPISEQLDDGLPPLTVAHGRVTFDDVSFAYRPDEQVIRNLSFTAEPGKVTALVGPSHLFLQLLSMPFLPKADRNNFV